MQFRRAYKRNDKPVCLATSTFLAHLVNQRVVHEIVALQLLTLLLERYGPLGALPVSLYTALTWRGLLCARTCIDRPTTRWRSPLASRASVAWYERLRWHYAPRPATVSRSHPWLAFCFSVLDRGVAQGIARGL